MKLTIVIPALNEEEKIGKVLERIPKAIPRIDRIIVMVIDDGSSDRTSEIAVGMGALVVKHGENLGLGITFQRAVDESLKLKTDIMVTIDADNQFDPGEIPKLIQPIIDEKADFVTGTRFKDPENIPKNIPLVKKWGNKKLASFISFASGQKLHDVSCGFRAYGKEALLHLNLSGVFTYTQETILDLAYKRLRIAEIPITVHYFKERKSRVADSIWRYAFRSGSIILRTIKNYKPLAFFGLLGLVIFVAGLLLDIAVFYHFIKTGSFSPYKIVGFMGAFMNAIGILVMFIAILADQIDKIRINQESLLYFEKLRKYYDDEK